MKYFLLFLSILFTYDAYIPFEIYNHKYNSSLLAVDMQNPEKYKLIINDKNGPFYKISTGWFLHSDPHGYNYISNGIFVDNLAIENGKPAVNSYIYPWRIFGVGEKYFNISPADTRLCLSMDIQSGELTLGLTNDCSSLSSEWKLVSFNS
jgi:hypothetical protein